MIIKKIEIAGFKSFANSTNLRFNHKTTAIIGPNGCGKSNVLDAIKWVLGEKSVKSMRGEKMEDIIFSGTENKKPSNFSQVAIHIDNSEKLLNIDHPEVKIGRRLYRDGQSQYLINDSRVTRKEIETLLMDTGLGKSSYSFMEQGQMDMILSSKPEDRRILFEEAAGISKFKSQKAEAEKNLEKTSMNITRLRDIMHSMEKELETKKIQAEKTYLYNDLAKRQKEHDLKIRFAQYKEQEALIEKLTEKISRKAGEMEKLDQKILLLKENNVNIEKEIEQLKKEHHEKDALNRVNKEKISQWESQIEDFAYRKKRIRQEISILEEKVKNFSGRLNSHKNKQNVMNQHRIEVDGNINSIEKDIESTLKDIDANKKEQAEIEHSIKDLRNEIFQKKNELKSTREYHERVIQDLLTSLKEEKANWENHEKNKTIRKKELDQSLNEINKQINEIIEKFNQKDNISPERFEEIFASIQRLHAAFQPDKISEVIDKISDISEGLRYILFEKGGIHSKKEEIDEKISILENSIVTDEESLEKKRKDLEEAFKNQHDLNSAYQQIKAHKKQIMLQAESLEKEINNINDIIENESQNLKYFESQYKQKEEEEIKLFEDEKKMDKDILDIRESIEKELNKIDSIQNKIEKTIEKKNGINDKLNKELEKKSKLMSEISELEFQSEAFFASKESHIQEIYHNFTLTIDELNERFANEKINIKQQKEKFYALQKEIENLGPVNPLAISEKERIEKLHSHNEEQLQDILKAEAGIIRIIDDIQKKSEEKFNESFNQIKKNFQMTFKKLFQGGEADLSLQDTEKPLESGIEISVQPPGKRPKSIRLLSGGERALTAIALMFGVYMVRSSPLCVLDEIDAPLDDQNVGRFLTLLSEFADKTQFILITHNKKTISHADLIFGVTMEEPGISKVITIDLTNKKQVDEMTSE